MKSFLTVFGALSLASALVPAQVGDKNSLLRRSTFANDTTHQFRPVVNPATNRDDIEYTVPSTNVSLFYDSNTTSEAMQVKHTMRYPTVVLEKIAYVSNVDCTNVSVAVTFNDASVFSTVQSSWAQGEFVMITNNLGDCDLELQRGFFMVESMTFDNKTLVATASSIETDVSSTAAETIIEFGNIQASTGLARRDIGDATANTTYNIAKTFTIEEDYTVYALPPYISVDTTAAATLAGDITFAGYLKYNWLTFQAEDFYFDIDASLSAGVALSAAISAQYNTTFSYTPAVLFYGLSIPGLLEIGPQLQFGIEAFVGASAKAVVTTELVADIQKGYVHVDLLDENLTTTSGWVPTYNTKVNVSAEVEAQVNPAVVLTVEIAINFFDGLLDLSTGVTASAGFENSLVLSASAGVDLAGVEDLGTDGTCDQGLLLNSEFVFDVNAFVTQYYGVNLYNVTIPLYEECFSWEE